MRGASLLVATGLVLALAGLARGQDWSAYRWEVRFDGVPAQQAANVRATGAGGYDLGLRAPRGEALLLALRTVAGGLEGASSRGFADHLDLAGVCTPEWRVRIRRPEPGPDGVLRADGLLAHGLREGDGFTAHDCWRFEALLHPGQGSAPAASDEPVCREEPGTAAGGEADGALGAPGPLERIPAHAVLEPTDVGASEAELVEQLGRTRPDEVTVVFLNCGKGEHRHHVPPVEVAGEQVDPLNANIRFLAGLRPDFLVLAEVSKPRADRPGTLDPVTTQVLEAAFPGRLLVPSILEFPEDNNNAIYSRFGLVHVAGEEAVRRDGLLARTPWTAPISAGPGPDLATVRTRWLDWSPLALERDPAAREEFRRAWGGDTYNTRAHTRIDFQLAGRDCVLFPVHFAMPWLALPKTTERDGFVVDAVQHHQLHGKGPLYYQIERARAEYEAVRHGRVVLIGDTNVARFPAAALPPLRTPAASGDGAPARDEALAWQLLARGFHDAFEGDRATWSWPNPSSSDPRVHLLPRSRIDNCLHGGEFQVVYRATFFPRGTDHGAVVVRLRLRRGPGAPPAFPPRPPATPADAEPPLLEVLSPERGALIAGQAVVVRGRASDPSGLEGVWIDGQPVAVAADGSFAHEVWLRPGSNLIRIEGRDRPGNTARALRAVGAGRLLAEDEPVPGALRARLGQSALAKRLRERDPLFERRLGWGLGTADVKVRATRAALGAPALDLVPRAGALGVEVRVPDVEVDLVLDVTLRVGGLRGRSLRIPVALRATRATLAAGAVADVREGAIRSRLEAVRVDLEGFSFDVRGIPAFVERWLRDAVREWIAGQLRAQVERVAPPELDRLLASVARPLHHRVLGRDVVVTLVPERVAFDAQGATVDLAANVAAGSGPALRTVSLGTVGAAPDLAGAPVGLALNDDLLDRIGHAAWRGGLLHQTLTPGDAGRLGAPAWVAGLDARVLAHFFPGSPALAGLPGDAPLRIELDPRAAPLFRPLPGGALEVVLGDAVATISVAPPGETPRPVVRAAVTIEARWRVSVDDGGKLTVRLEGAPVVHTEVFDSPIGALQRRGVEALLDYVLPPAVERLSAAWSGFPLPLPDDLRPRALGLASEGPAGDHVTARGELP